MLEHKNIVYLMMIFAVLVAVILNRTIGFLFSGMVFSYFLASTQGDTYQFARNSRIGRTLSAVVVGTLSFMILGSLIINEPFNFQSVIKIYGTSTLTAISLDNSFLKFLIWGIFIPMSETLFFLGFVGRILVKLFRVKDGVFSAQLVWVSLVVGSLAAVAHIAAQGVVDTSLALDFAFFSLSMTITTVTKGLNAPAGMHILANSSKLLFGGL